jgi:hypothetical protein
MGKQNSVTADPEMPLLWVLRDLLSLTGRNMDAVWAFVELARFTKVAAPCVLVKSNFPMRSVRATPQLKDSPHRRSSVSEGVAVGRFWQEVFLSVKETAMLKISGLLLILLLVAFSDTSSAQYSRSSKTEADQVTADKWRQDLRYFAEELPKRHKNLFHTMTREQFESAVKNLNERIPSLDRNQIIVEMAQIVAMIGDGHSQMGLTWDPKIGFKQYPLRLYLYSDGLFVRAATPQYAGAIGARVVKIGKLSADEAMKVAEKIIQRDNEMTARDVLPSRLVIPEVLQVLGIIDDMEHAQFVTEDANGKRSTVELAPMERGAEVKWVRANEGAQAPLPLYLKDPSNNFWFEYLKDSRSIYVQFNSVQDKENETIAGFFKHVFEFVQANPVERFILDIRLNNGGDNTLIKPLIQGLIKCDKINQRGRLFTIIGRLTFSAAQNLANRLERDTNTLFVGEPTGGSPNHYGDAVNVVLPNSGITVRVSTLWWQDMDPRDTRPWIAPQIPTELSAEDYRTNNDPALKAILSHSSDAITTKKETTGCSCIN